MAHRVSINLLKYTVDKNKNVRMKNGTPVRIFYKCKDYIWDDDKIAEFDKADLERRKEMLRDIFEEHDCQDAEVWSSPSLSREGHQVPMMTYEVKPRGYKLNPPKKKNKSEDTYDDDEGEIEED